MTGSLTESCLFHSTLSLKSQSFSFVLHNLMTKTIHPPGPWSGCIFNITTVFSVSKPTIKWSETKARSNGLCLSLSTIPSLLSSSSAEPFYEQLRVQRVSVVVEAPRCSQRCRFLSRVEGRWADCWQFYWRHWKTKHNSD